MPLTQRDDEHLRSESLSLFCRRYLHKRPWYIQSKKQDMGLQDGTPYLSHHCTYTSPGDISWLGYELTSLSTEYLSTIVHIVRNDRQDTRTGAKVASSKETILLSLPFQGVRVRLCRPTTLNSRFNPHCLNNHKTKHESTGVMHTKRSDTMLSVAHTYSQAAERSTTECLDLGQSK